MVRGSVVSIVGGLFELLFMQSGSSIDFLHGWYYSELRQRFMSKKFIDVFPVFTGIFNSLS